MQCLRTLAEKHSIAIITSIHQPNQEIVLMFDKLYVLAKGGNCIFSGEPHEMVDHLMQNKIPLNENQIPIEQLLKLGSVETAEQIDELIENTRETLTLSVLKDCEKQTKLSAGGIQRKSKSFSLPDLWYVMLRSMTQLFIRQWRLLLLQFTFYIGFGICACFMFKEGIGKPDSCFNPSELGNSTCIDELENDTLLFQNQNFLFFISCMTLYVHLCSSALAYSIEAKTYFYEHQNCNYLVSKLFIQSNLARI